MDCRFCSSEAIALFHMDKGCMCYPYDREQALCPQHIMRATPLGGMVLKEVLSPPYWKWFCKNEGIESGIN